MKPHCAPAWLHVVTVHADTQMPFWQDWLPVHWPQSGVRPPQPSAT
jgi:hypothetical protein